MALPIKVGVELLAPKDVIHKMKFLLELSHWNPKGYEHMQKTEPQGFCRMQTAVFL